MSEVGKPQVAGAMCVVWRHRATLISSRFVPLTATDPNASRSPETGARMKSGLTSAMKARVTSGVACDEKKSCWMDRFRLSK